MYFAWPHFEQGDWTKWSPEVTPHLNYSVIILKLNLRPVRYLVFLLFPPEEEKVFERPYPDLVSKVTVFWSDCNHTLFCRHMWAYSACTQSQSEAAASLLAWHWVKANKSCWEVEFSGLVLILFYQVCVVSHWLGDLSAVCPMNRLCVQERTGDALEETEIPGFEVQAPGLDLIFVIIGRSW